jgi:DNA-binding response OmpR family regulator
MIDSGHPDPPDSGPKILIVTNELPLRERLYDLLTQHGYGVHTVANGKVGAEVLALSQPDLIIADRSANDCPGWGLPDWVRRFNPNIPIIYVRHSDEDAPDARTINDIQAYFRSDTGDGIYLDAVRRWTSEAAHEPVNPLSFPGPVLAIDDEPGYLNAVRDYLQPRGCTVITAGSGEEGLETLERTSPALVLLDLKMPGMDGLVALKKIKFLRPELPVVMTTAVEDRHLIAQAFSLGALEYIVKPYNFNALRALLAKITSGRAQPPGTREA